MSSAWRSSFSIQRGTATPSHWRNSRVLDEPQTVKLQYLPRGKHSWRTAGTYTVNSRGFLYRKVARRAAYWRFTWDGKASRKAAP